MKIIMISLDTTRADHLGCYGYPLPTSPYLDQIARQGALFEQAYASDIPTEVAHTSVFTGRVGLSTGVVAHGSDIGTLPKTFAWLPEMLRREGYTTAAVDNMYQLKEWFARGYQYYVNSVGQQRWIDGRVVTDKAKAWMQQHADEDFFLFLHYWDAHTPYLPPQSIISKFYAPDRDPHDPSNRSMDRAYNHPAYPFFKHHHFDLLGPVTDASYVNARYDAELSYQDSLLQELDDWLEELGIFEDTWLILFGDHGESLTEHDIYWDHCGLYQTTVHVPIIMRWPGRIAAGTRVPGFVQHPDLMPTVLEAVGIQPPGDLDGISLWPCLNSLSTGTREIVVLSECAWQASRAVRNHRYKLIRTRDSGLFRRPPLELYDVLNDPGETTNLIDDMADVAQALVAQLDSWIAEKLAGKSDPMEEVLRLRGLPFRRRIDQILADAGWTWEEWSDNPDRRLYDAAVSSLGRH